MSINKMTADQKMNLLLLKDFIKSIDPINFDMGTYCEVESDNEIVMETLGDYVTEELQKKLSKDRYRSWSDVSEELFGTHDSDGVGVGKYLFGVDWEAGITPEGNSTNTIEHALYRIDRVLAAVTDEDYKALRQEYTVLT